MKRRYSPAARRAHLAHLRAKYGKSAQLSMQIRPLCAIQGCENEANYHYNGGHFCWRHAPQPEPAPMPEQPIDCDCPSCLAEQQPALQGRCIGCGVLTPDGVDVDVDGLFGQDWCCKDCQKEPWAKPIEGRYSFDPEGGTA